MKVCSSATCSLAGQQQPLANFSFKAPGKYRAQCKSCKNAHYRKWYATADKTVHQARVRARRDKQRQLNRARLANLAQAVACVDCGIQNPNLIEWDHRDPNTKKQTVSALADNGVSWDLIQTEIDKCDPRCTNCHMYRTHSELNGKGIGWRAALLTEAQSEGVPLNVILLNKLTDRDARTLSAILKNLPQPDQHHLLDPVDLHEILNHATHPKGRSGSTRSHQLKQICVALYYSHTPCADCGTTNLHHLTADHVYGPRTHYIANLTTHGTIEDLLAELLKCVARCGNCHMLKTRAERGELVPRHNTAI